MSKQLIIFLITSSEEEDLKEISDDSQCPEHYQIPEEQPSESGRILSIFRKESFSTDSVKNIGWADEVYIAFHEESDERRPDDQIDHEKMVGRSYSREEGRDRVYSSFKSIVEAEKKGSKEKRGKALADLVDAFSVDWYLETKLEILHRCLTKRRAKSVVPSLKREPETVIDEEFPSGLRGERNKLLRRSLGRSPFEEDDEWKVRHVVWALADNPLDGKEMPDDPDSRQKVLMMMRDALLRDEFE